MTRERSHRVIPFAAGLTVSGVAVLCFSTSDQRPVLASPPPPAPRLVTTLSAPSCPVSLGKQVESIKAFGEMMPVFRHDRCFNCHGGLDITSESHEGSDVAQKTKLDPRSLLTIQERKKLHAGCGGCHSNVKGSLTRRDGTKLSGWLVAPKPMLWDGKDDHELCMQMKRFEPTGAQFVDHLKTDHNEIEFIAAAFNGDRALGDLLDAYDLASEPPPGDQRALVAKAQKWVDILGKGYSASSECGCVMPGIKLQVEHRSGIDPTHITHRAGFVGFSGDAKFEVTLTKVHEAKGRTWYQGTKSLVRPLQVYFAAQGCEGTASEREDWLWSAELDTASKKLKLQWGFTPSDEKGEAACTRGGHRSRVPLEPSIFGGQSLEPLVMPLDSETVQVTGKEEQGSGLEWLKIKVIAAPGN